MSVVTPERVLEALRSIEDPDLRRDIVSLGFVKEIVIQEGAVAFQIELTTPACPVKDELKAQAEQAVAALPGVTQVTIEMTAQVRGAARNTQDILRGVTHVIAIASGKGGVGKSALSANLAVALAQTGASVGLLDADIYGPSIPQMMGISREPDVIKTESGPKMLPIMAHGVAVMSLGFILKADQAVAWRGPMLGKAVSDMLTGCAWGELDYMVVDLPPGTGDVPMSLAQLVPISGVVVITTPQPLVQDIARKSVAMFQMLEQALKKNIPILGIVENMSGGIFGAGGGKLASERIGVPFLGTVPLDPAITLGSDTGVPAVLGGAATPAGAAYQNLAQNIAAKLSVLEFEGRKE